MRGWLLAKGDDLMGKSIEDRRKVLEKVVQPVHGRVQYSELTNITTVNVLKALMQRAMDEGTEWVVACQWYQWWRCTCFCMRSLSEGLGYCLLQAWKDL